VAFRETAIAKLEILICHVCSRPTAILCSVSYLVKGTFGPLAVQVGRVNTVYDLETCVVARGTFSTVNHHDILDSSLLNQI